MNGEFPHLRPLAKWTRHGVIRVEDPKVRTRLDRYLAGRFGYRSRTQWARMISAGRILINGRRCRPSQTVAFGDQVDYVPSPRKEPEVTVEYRILHEDDAVLAVDKPAHLPVHPVGRYYRNTLLWRLLEARGETLDEPGVRIVHRLDRETSGVLLFGKDRASAAFLAGQFEDHRVAKEYLAVVHGIPAEARFTVDAELGPNPASRVRKAVGTVPPGMGRAARTDFEVLSAGPGHALLRALPRTGRLHQIRVHLKHAGTPIIGDKLYGLDEGHFLKLAAGQEYTEEDRRQLLLPRQGLHAWRITFTHPADRKRMTCTAPLPEDLRKICHELLIPFPEGLDRAD